VQCGNTAHSRTGGGSGRAHVKFAPEEDPIECRRTRATCKGAHACEKLDPALRTTVRFELDTTSRDAIERVAVYGSAFISMLADLYH
jgi:hypothetical protein